MQENPAVAATTATDIPPRVAVSFYPEPFASRSQRGHRQRSGQHKSADNAPGLSQKYATTDS